MSVDKGFSEQHILLLRLFLENRADIVDRIDGLLNAQRQPVERQQDRDLLHRRIDDVVYLGAGIADSHLHLRGALEEARNETGFRPRHMHGLHNDLPDPAELMLRAFHLWRETRWPGRAGRRHYADILFNLYVIRHLTLLCLHLWDDGSGHASDRLTQIQLVLDELWEGAPPDQPRLVRDARWLVQLAQSPATDDLGVYFVIAAQIAESFSATDRLEILKAGVRMTAGHLRSQTRHISTRDGVGLDDQALVRSTRDSNALDVALLVQEFVPVLEAYEDASGRGDDSTRLSLASVICQGLSPDPELFVNRVELLRAYSMIEHLFATTDGDGRAVYTPMGERHVRLVQDYQARIGRVATQLLADCQQFRPTAGAYSPFGVFYGFSSDLLQHMVLRSVVPHADPRFGLEDVFVDGDAASGKLAWVNGWRKLPHVNQDVAQQFEYPQHFAEEIFDRLEHALRRRASGEGPTALHQLGRLHLSTEDAAASDARAPELPARFIRSTNPELVRAERARSQSEAALLSERREGKFLVSYETPDGWVAVTKSVLTDVLDAGDDAVITGLPAGAVDMLRLMCPGLILVDGGA